MINARIIKSQIEKASFNLYEWEVEKSYKCYNVFLTTYGLSDGERQSMTGDEVNDKRTNDNAKVEKMAQLFKVQPRQSSITILA